MKCKTLTREQETRFDLQPVNMPPLLFQPKYERKCPLSADALPGSHTSSWVLNAAGSS